MKKRSVLIVCSVLLILALGAAAAYFGVRNHNLDRAALEAADWQEQCHEEYAALRQLAGESTLTVTEQGTAVGTYPLADLGLLDGTLQAIEAAFPETARRAPADFSALPREEQCTLAEPLQDFAVPEIRLTGVPELQAIEEDLLAVERTAPRDAYGYFEKGQYRVEPEVPGTTLQPEPIRQALEALLTDHPLEKTLQWELTDCSCYVQPEITAENGQFDWPAMLEKDAAGKTISLDFLGQPVQLELAPLVRVDEAGVVSADRQALEDLAAQWAQTYLRHGVPYLFDSHVEGEIPLDFLSCDYDLDQAALTEQLAGQLEQLDPAPVEAPFRCTRNGEPFAIGPTHVEVNISRQQMSFFKDGKLLAHTDIVSGYPWGHWTPPGLYAVQSLDTDTWLTGPDYNVFVQYWVGFFGAYGIHDASWRTRFGGENYLSNGSHGCVNTPTEPMKTIFENIEVGVPVLIYPGTEPAKD